MVHFLLPFVVFVVLGFHLHLLHRRGRRNPFFTHQGARKVRFFPYYWVKDIVNVIVYVAFLVLMLLYPYALGEVELYEEANPMRSPIHIVPEWYFCAQYAILRRVPNKGMGVVLILLRILILFFYPGRIGYITPGRALGSLSWVLLVFSQIWLTYLGGAPIAQPFIWVSQVRVGLFFLTHFLIMAVNLIRRYFFEV